LDEGGGRSLHPGLLSSPQNGRKLIPKGLSSLLYVDHIEARGEDLFRLACQEDLEGIVAKRKDGAYGPRADWIKIKNSAYSQIVGRHELFEKRSAKAKRPPGRAA
jgi:ATP-dependent DNA ligase